MNFILFQEQEALQDLLKGSPRTAVLLACCSCSCKQLSRPLLPTQVLLVDQFPEEFQSADALA